MTQSSTKKIRWSTSIFGLLLLCTVLGLVALLVAYGLPRSYASVETLVHRMPLPVAVVGYRYGISFRELAENVNSVKRFYENQDFSQVGLRVDFSTEDGKKRLKVREKEVLNKMIEDQVIILLARKRGIFISQEMAHQGVTRKLEEHGSVMQVKENLKRLYDWDMVDFETKVVLPSLYEEKLQDSFHKEVDPVAVAQKKIEQAAEALRQGTSFADVVTQYSDGRTAQTGGDLGWFSLADLAPELRVPVASQKVGVPGNVIESSLGFHIVLVDELKNEKERQLYRVRQIFSRKDTFAGWLSGQMKGLSLWVFSPEYRYDKDTTRVEFRDPVWQKFEEDLYKKASGDPSFFL